MVAGAGTGSTPCAVFTVPSPSTTTPVKSTRIYNFNLQGPMHPHATPVAANVGWAAVTEFTY